MNRKIVFITIFISSFLITRAVFAYDDKTTHPALTSEVVDFYNLNFNQRITTEEKEWIISGSILEDTPPRWINHFYDPIYKTGWSGEGGFVPKEIMQKFSDVFLSSASPVSSINWAHNQELQSEYKLYRGNQTWEKAIYEYVKNKDKKAAYYALGHVLHLLEDMAVPEHTRNDTHPNDSPYENYSTRFTRDTFHIIDDLRSKNYQPTILNSLDDYFESLAGYSNNYFFSKDTINDGKYNKPKIIKDDGNFAYGIDKNSQFYALAAVDYKKIDEYFFEKIYYIKNVKEYDSILNVYWVRLSREAVLSGAGVIDLFFKEAKRAENDPSLLKKPPANISTIFSLYGEIDKFSNFFNDIYSGIKNLTNDFWNNLTGNEQAGIINQSLTSSQDVRSLQPSVI